MFSCSLSCWEGISKEPLLLPLLLESKPQDSLYELHKGWVEQVFFYVSNQKQKGQWLEPSLEFDQDDAREVLAPLLQKFHNYTLSEKRISRLFAPNVIPSLSNQVTDPSFFYSPDVKEALLQTAQKIVALAKGGDLWVIGQTPAYLGQVVKKIAGKEVEVFFLPYSGRADYVRPLKGKWSAFTCYENILTKRRQAIYQEILAGQGLSPERYSQGRKVCYLDCTTGPSAASLLTVLARWFQEEEVAFPPLTLLHMDSEEDYYVQNQNGKWILSERPEFDLKMSDNLSFNCPIVFLGMDGEMTTAFDKIHQNLRLVPSFPALYWRAGYETYFLHFPTEEGKKLLKHYLD